MSSSTLQVVGSEKTASTAVLRSCPNQKAAEMTICEPWSFTPAIPPNALKDKGAFRSWSAETNTDHLFYTASEGLNAAHRVNKTNPLKRLHAFIADFDAQMTMPLVQAQLAKWAGEYQPNWISRTFSDHVRAVWLFEEPLLLDCEQLRKPFLALAAKELRLEKFLPGLDEAAWFNLSDIYEVGRDWVRVAESPLSKNLLWDMLFRASEKIRWKSDGPIIPLEIIAGWIDEDFPSRWDGPFEEGSRGCAFFDPASTNPTSAIVTEAGMICFSQAKLFYSWLEIFPKRAKKYNEDRIGGAVADVFYDGKCYWRKNENGIFIFMSRDEFETALKVKHGLYASKERFESHSEVDAARHFVHEQRRVDGALPLLYDESEVIYSNGKRFVNSSRIRITQPADGRQQWGENFPWVANFLDTRLDSALVACAIEGEPPAYAKDIFNAWNKRFYLSAVQGHLLKGHALFLVGPTNSGKTLLSLRVVGGLLGGHSEASDFLGGGTGFNRELIETPLWCIDDGTLSGGDTKSHQKFSEIIKRTVANPYFSYHPKFFDQQRAEWRGRVIVTLNGDATSVQMIPNLYESIEDKVIVLKFADHKMSFPKDVEAIIARELPFYGRWLLDWEVPAHIAGDSRFGIKAFIHEDIRAAAIHAGEAGDILEIIELWIQRTKPQYRYEARWHGTAAEWVSVVSSSGDEVLQNLVRKFTPKTIGRRLSDLSRIRGSRVTKDDSSKAKLNGNRYFISLEDRGEQSSNGAVRTSFCEQRKRAA